MWFSLFAIVFILAITFFQGLQGAFSAIINCILAILSAALAFGLYENVYYSFLVDRQPEHGRAISMIAIFVFSLLILRVLADAIVKGNVHFQTYVDRGVGGLFGLITSLIIVGMMTLGFQMLPFGPKVLGFQRYTLVGSDGQDLAADKDLTKVDWSTLNRRRNSVWLSPDGFTAALATHLSNNALAGENRLGQMYPDFIEAVHRSKGVLPASALHAVPEDAMTLDGYWDLRENDFDRRVRFEDDQNRKMIRLERVKESADSGMKRIGIRVTLSEPDVKELKMTQESLRLLGRIGKDGQVREYLPIGVSDEFYPSRIIELADGELIVRKSARDTLDFAFAVPEDSKFEPLFIEYKQNARVDFTAQHNYNEREGAKRPAPLKATEPPGGQQQPGGTPPPAGGGAVNPAGRVHGVNVADMAPEYSERLPFNLRLTQYNWTNKEGGSKIGGGMILAPLDAGWNPVAGNEQPIEAFEVPQGQALLHVNATKLDPASMYGRARGMASDKTPTIFAVDSTGQQYKPCGKYAIANVGGKIVFEIQYFTEDEVVGGANLQEFRQIKNQHLTNRQETSLYTILFRIPSGVRIVRMDSGNKPLPLDSFNLVAP